VLADKTPIGGWFYTAAWKMKPVRGCSDRGGSSTSMAQFLIAADPAFLVESFRSGALGEGVRSANGVCRAGDSSTAFLCRDGECEGLEAPERQLLNGSGDLRGVCTVG